MSAPKPSEFEVTEYRYPRRRPGEYEQDPRSAILIHRTIPGADVWAVRCLGERLVRHGDRLRWVMEPRPSERSESFVQRATFTLAEVSAVIEARLAVDAREHERWQRKQAKRDAGGGA